MRTICSLWLALFGMLHAAGLTFDKPLLEIHAAADARTAVADFDFENKTDKPVTITRYDKTCSCLSLQIPGGKLVYQPGEKGVLRAAFDLGNLSGVVDKMIVMWLDGDAEAKPSITLTAKVHIPVLVVMDVKTLKWALGGKAEAQKIDIQMNHTKPIRIVTTTCTSELFKTELKTLEEGKHYELWVTPLEMNAPGLAIIRLETDCAIERHKVQQAFATVRRERPEVGPATQP
jgi:hypothetical protein